MRPTIPSAHGPAAAAEGEGAPVGPHPVHSQPVNQQPVSGSSAPPSGSVASSPPPHQGQDREQALAALSTLAPDDDLIQRVDHILRAYLAHCWGVTPPQVGTDLAARKLADGVARTACLALLTDLDLARYAPGMSPPPAEGWVGRATQVIAQVDPAAGDDPTDTGAP